MSIPTPDAMSLTSGQESVILAQLLAAYFDYAGMPANIGADLDPSILKGLQAAIGTMLGYSAGFLLIEKHSLKDLFDNWFGPKGSGRSPDMWKLVFVSGGFGLVSFLLFPDNRYVQAASVFAGPIFWKKGFLYNAF